MPPRRGVKVPTTGNICFQQPAHPHQLSSKSSRSICQQDAHPDMNRYRAVGDEATYIIIDFRASQSLRVLQCGR